MEVDRIHHLSAITADAEKNHFFYTRVLGLKLIKKTVQQNRHEIYHLFYGDKSASLGSVISFFYYPYAGKTYGSNNSISMISLELTSRESMSFWADRLNRYGIDFVYTQSSFEKEMIQFQDYDGTPLAFVLRRSNKEGLSLCPSVKIPSHHAFTSIASVYLRVRDASVTVAFLTKVLKFSLVAAYEPFKRGQAKVFVLKSSDQHLSAEIHVEQREDLDIQKPGRGSIHHLALSVDNKEELASWSSYLDSLRIKHSGIIDRYYFKSIYVEDGNGIVYELSTEGPSYTIDENIDELGRRLSLPDFLEKDREKIMSQLEHLTF